LTLSFRSYTEQVQEASKNGSTKKQCISYLQTSRELVIQLGEEVLCNILIEFDIPTKLVRLIEMCMNENPGRQTFI
jgi:hypothetical protein